MQGNWTSRTSGPAQAASLAEATLSKEVLVFLQGKNPYGDQIYSYVLVALRNLAPLKAKLASHVDFSPSEFGSVIAAGQGYPPDEVVAELAESYNMYDTPISALGQVPAEPIIPQAPKFWGDDEAEEIN